MLLAQPSALTWFQVAQQVVGTASCTDVRNISTSNQLVACCLLRDMTAQICTIHLWPSTRWVKSFAARQELGGQSALTQSRAEFLRRYMTGAESRISREVAAGQHGENTLSGDADFLQPCGECETARASGKTDTSLLHTTASLCDCHFTGCMRPLDIG